MHIKNSHEKEVKFYKNQYNIKLKGKNVSGIRPTTYIFSEKNLHFKVQYVWYTWALLANEQFSTSFTLLGTCEGKNGVLLHMNS